MRALKTWLGNPHRHFPLLPLIGVVLMLLLARNMGTYPSLFADEYYYNAFARLTPAANAAIPSYLYYALFGVTNSCGDGFLECTRLLNLLLLAAGAPFIYLIARRLMSATRAGVVTVLALLAPFNLFTVYFMPETAYFLAFWILTWTALRLAERPGALRALATGAALGVAWLVKVHAMFLVPPLCVFLVFVAWTTRNEAGRHWLLRALLYLALAMGAALLLRFGLGYLMAGKAALSLLGTFYGGSAGGGKPFGSLLLAAVQSLQGHLLALVVLFGVPLGAMAISAVSGADRRAQASGTGALLVYSALMMGALLGMTTLFSATVAEGANESLQRLHLRYYDFALPLLLIIAGAQLARPVAAGARQTLRTQEATPHADVRKARRTRLLIALVLGAVLLYAHFTLIRDFSSNLFDAPELWILRYPAWQTLATALGLLTLACWVVSHRSGVRAYLYLAAPLLTVISAYTIQLQVRASSTPDAYVRAGVFARNHLTPAQIDRLTIVAASGPGLFRTKFHLDRTEPEILMLPPGQAFTASALGNHNQWALVVGDHPAPPGALAHNVDHGYTLYEMRRPDKLLLAIDFSRTELGLANVSGVSAAEDWGRWSDGRQLDFESASALPVRLRINLKARAVGANIDAPFTVRVGAQSQEVRFGQESTGITLDFDTSGAERHITIDVPHPVSAATIGGHLSDKRQIGLALISMELAERPATLVAGTPATSMK